MSEDPSLKYRRALARAELRAAGVRADRLNAAVKLVDVDQLDVADGELVGLADQLDGLKEDWPELFAAPEPEDREPVDDDEDGQGDEGERPDTGADLPGSAREAVALLRSVGDSEGAARLLERHRRRPDPRTPSQLQAAVLLGRDPEPPEAA